MAWSTREVAELAGTTVKAVRHYHKVGLLDEPDRASNGYKQYGVHHLVRLLRIRRLVDLGVTLPQIAAIQDDDEHPDDSLRRLDRELEATIDRLQRIRDELAEILRHQLPTDLPAELVPAVKELSAADRALMVVYGRVLAPDGIEAFREMLLEYQDHPVSVAFSALAEDAPEEIRADVVRRMVPMVIEMFRGRPDFVAAIMQAPGGPAYVTQTLRQATTDVYNPAQLDVLDRLGRELEAEAAARIAAARDAEEQPRPNPNEDSRTSSLRSQ